MHRLRGLWPDAALPAVAVAPPLAPAYAESADALPLMRSVIRLHRTVIRRLSSLSATCAMIEIILGTT
jgi:hypothetical protein